MATVAAYVDGFNLYYGMRHKHGHKYHWLDVVELVRQVRPKDQIAVVRYFTAVVKGDPLAAANQIHYLQALEARNGSLLDIRRGWFRTKSAKPCHRCRQAWVCACPRAHRTFEEKETDVALGVAMVEDAAHEVGDLTLLVSADSDFVPAVEAVRRIDPGRPVFLAMPPGNVQPNKRFSGIGHFHIPESAFSAAQLPPIVASPVGMKMFTRPSKWI